MDLDPVLAAGIVLDERDRPVPFVEVIHAGDRFSPPSRFGPTLADRQGRFLMVGDTERHEELELSTVDAPLQRPATPPAAVGSTSVIARHYDHAFVRGTVRIPLALDRTCIAAQLQHADGRTLWGSILRSRDYDDAKVCSLWFSGFTSGSWRCVVLNPGTFEVLASSEVEVAPGAVADVGTLDVTAVVPTMRVQVTAPQGGPFDHWSAHYVWPDGRRVAVICFGEVATLARPGPGVSLRFTDRDRVRILATTDAADVELPGLPRTLLALPAGHRAPPPHVRLQLVVDRMELMYGERKGEPSVGAERVVELSLPSTGRYRARLVASPAPGVELSVAADFRRDGIQTDVSEPIELAFDPAAWEEFQALVARM